MTQKEKAYKVMRGLLRAAAFGSPIKGYNKAELRVIAPCFDPTPGPEAATSERGK